MTAGINDPNETSDANSGHSPPVDPTQVDGTLSVGFLQHISTLVGQDMQVTRPGKNTTALFVFGNRRQHAQRGIPTGSEL